VSRQPLIFSQIPQETAYETIHPSSGSGHRARGLQLDSRNQRYGRRAGRIAWQRCQRSVYFDYDSYEVKSEYKDLVTAHAKFLNENRQFKMLIQGNTDERGSREYNLALGQKRADAIKKMLALLGAREDQLESVSLGEEKPKNEGHNEAAWAQNRRGDMLYSGEF
jgi:peptidoglycan-associated lipoprotein